MWTLKEFMAADLRTLMGWPTVKPVRDCVLCRKPITDTHTDPVRMISAGSVHEACFRDHDAALAEFPPRGRRRRHGQAELSRDDTEN